jgi:hypothetical protein
MARPMAARVCPSSAFTLVNATKWRRVPIALASTLTFVRGTPSWDPRTLISAARRAEGTGEPSRVATPD